jgi:hypothetical protein
VNITFAGYAQQSQVDAWAMWAASSTWLQQVGQDYGVGTGPAPTLVHVTTAAPQTSTDAQVQALLTQLLKANTAPAPTTNTLYILYYPSTSTVSVNGNLSCTGFPGYHSAFTSETGQSIFYAVVVDCPERAQAYGLTQLQETEAAASYDLIEAATDPDASMTAWVFTDPTNSWSYSYGEVADMCAETTIYEDPSGNVAQRSWSNTAAMTNGSPCVPAPEGPFFAVSGPSQLLGTAAGSSVQITVQAWSASPVSSWNAFLFPASGTITNPTITPGWPALLGGSGQGTPVNNGGSATFTVTMPASAQSQDYVVLYAWSLAGSPLQPGTGDTLWWPIVVYIQ